MSIYKEIDISQHNDRPIHDVPSAKKAKIDSILDNFVTYFKDEELS